MTEGRNSPVTTYPPQPPVRKLTRSRSNKMLGGVCAGVANYLNMDVNLVRILTVVLALFTGIPVVAYIVCLLVVPEEDVPPYVGPQTVHVPDSATHPGGQPGPSTTAPADPVWGPDGAPWDQSSGPVPTAEPGPAPADPAVPNEAAPVADPDPVSETPAPEPAPGQESAWESAPADPGQTTDETGEQKDKPNN